MTLVVSEDDDSNFSEWTLWDWVWDFRGAIIGGAICVPVLSQDNYTLQDHALSFGIGFVLTFLLKLRPW